MIKKHPLLARFSLLVIFPLFVMSAATLMYLKRSMPVTEGELTVKGIDSELRLNRDDSGVVYIEAASDYDAFFAVGYAHAQDRMWQLELQRRLASGRLSEIFGVSMLSHDVWMRTLGFYELSENSYDVLSVEAQKSLQAYSDGINAWLSEIDVLPPEFIILGVDPENWTPIDSLAWSKVFALNISGNLRKEISNTVKYKYLSAAQQKAFETHYPGDAPTTISSIEESTISGLENLFSQQLAMEDDLNLGGDFVGSNAWVVSGEYTDSGFPYIANDPHLSIQIPSSWYVVDIQSEKLNVAGMTIVGLPVVIFGKNEHIAWAGTAMLADVQDLIVEQVNPRNSGEYKRNGKWLGFKEKAEKIAVKAEFPSALMTPIEPVNVLVRSTDKGPVLTNKNKGLDQTISLRWTALDKNDTSYESFLKMNYATNWGEFRSALDLLVAPTLNFLYADKENNIGYVGAGRIPVRRKGGGQVPAAGWGGEDIWNGYIPVEEMPSKLNPEKGYIVTANNKIVNSNYQYFISEDWADPARAVRIEQLLVEKIIKNQKITASVMKEIQVDQFDVSVSDIKEYLIGLRFDGDTYSEAYSLFLGWSGDMSGQSVGASIFNVWMKHFRAALFDDDLKGYWNKVESDSLQDLGGGATHTHIINAINSKEYNWCDNKSSTVVESCEEIMAESFVNAIDELVELAGTDPQSWSWGALHKAKFDHMPFSKYRFMDLLFGRSVESGGSENSVNVANAVWEEGEGYDQTFGPGFRQLILFDGGDDFRHLFVNSTGQSGNLLSPHYSDLLDSYSKGKYKAIESRESKSNLRKLTLKPYR